MTTQDEGIASVGERAAAGTQGSGGAKAPGRLPPFPALLVQQVHAHRCNSGGSAGTRTTPGCAPRHPGVVRVDLDGI